MKQNRKPSTLIYPLPAAIISCGSTPEEYNIITLSWLGTICSQPPMCYISVRPERHSHAIITRNREFVINLTTEELTEATDWCGTYSGAKYNKFKDTNLTPGKASIVHAPIIEESPLCIECRVKEIMHLGSHDMFISDVVNILVDEKYVDTKTDKFDLEKAGLMVYSQHNYYGIGRHLGTSGFSIQKKNR